jgi:hypothetical protein
VWRFKLSEVDQALAMPKPPGSVAKNFTLQKTNPRDTEAWQPRHQKRS